MNRPRLLIEEWLPAQAISVECMRERGASSALPPLYFLHVWWARRPLTASRAAVLASLLPADFDRDCFERLLGFYATSDVLIENERKVEAVRLSNEQRIANPHGPRAFGNSFPARDIDSLQESLERLWCGMPTVIDPMAGGGSIPFEAARLGLSATANEYNPVACSVLEATVDYPFRFGTLLAEKARDWGRKWRQRFNDRMGRFYETGGIIPAYTYIYAHTVPCPDTGHPTPLVPDWHLLKPKNGLRIVAEPVILNESKGEWTVRIRELGRGAGQLRELPQPTYSRGKGFSLFTKAVIPADYIKAMAQQGKMGSVLYSIATKAASNLEFRPPEPTDLKALMDAEEELERLRPQWERDAVIPTEEYPEVSSDTRPRLYGMPYWSDLFSSRQMLAFGVLVDELRQLRPKIIEAEGQQRGMAIEHLLAFAIDKLINYNSRLSFWHSLRGVMGNVFEKHDFSFKPTYAEMAVCIPRGGLEWAIDNVLEAYEKICELPCASESPSVPITLGSATNLMEIDDKSITAVVVDPPYADNVQYSELADFFYVWLKRTQGHRRPEWFSTYLCEHDEEAVVNISRHRENGKVSTSEAREEAQSVSEKSIYGPAGCG